MESSQEKSLPASERKLQKSREDGQGARSRDLSHLAILGAGAACLLGLAPQLMASLQLAMSQQLAFDASTVMAPGHMLSRLQDMVVVGLIASVVFALLTGGAALISAVGAGGWIFSSKPITPQFSRLNPISGISNLFSKQQMANVAKMVLMTGILSYVAWKFMGNSVEQVAMLVLQPSPLALRHVADWLISGMSLLLLVVFLAAVVDVPLQAYFFKDQLKMSHEEVKQEHKESDGDPHTKGRIRQRQREVADRASVAAVPKADFVVMNPTHYAVALKYDEKTMSAPQVISRGTDLIAMSIRDIAKKHNVPVLQSPMLARALYAHAELDQAIPAKLYTAVAQVLAYVYRLKAAMRGEGRMPDSVPDPYVPPELDPLNRTPVQGASV
ncbi:MAG: EscU/YscU/HrcU family type III secretion system export apparatus switch protein [Acidovorax sp.]|jgi:flagellar biosynthetic protein FlhB|uniref:EscU/YscU/HrcU family type III secretion system export apparatus switch protein n=1 Tax=Acidovorax sp. TaxID=1872122 RepID=UPI000B10795F|nr:EscU/YscU/HrcU family type III secretion system export apparatus switch protein [Acidovorax sp.]MCO4093991.1 EscU/YscU/HrcU family type III secretion system export apparatus switch protein [Acidovorax sp.]MDH4427456.1 EscU/YscU/HrcU family type III secretion system export apparatus switch protein [Acidovorax sp.]MDH4446967.1 EscU/YscU/HrcU family type III secretion system export apparatus switch protein [Acidovorax sp.]MDH4462601.1 EscU/YscU/HrcU family type III secretion system export appar